MRFEGYCGPVRRGHFLKKAMRDLVGKTAFVTGAASGIGFGIATALAQAGVKVMLCDIEEAALTKAAADLKLTNAVDLGIVSAGG